MRQVRYIEIWRIAGGIVHFPAGHYWCIGAGVIATYDHEGD